MPLHPSLHLLSYNIKVARIWVSVQYLEMFLQINVQSVIPCHFPTLCACSGSEILPVPSHVIPDLIWDLDILTLYLLYK